MKNPFERQALFHKKEAQKWRKINIILGIILFFVIISLFTCCTYSKGDRFYATNSITTRILKDSSLQITVGAKTLISKKINNNYPIYAITDGEYSINTVDIDTCVTMVCIDAYSLRYTEGPTIYVYRFSTLDGNFYIDLGRDICPAKVCDFDMG